MTVPACHSRPNKTLSVPRKKRVLNLKHVCTGIAGIKIYNGLAFAPAGPGNDIAEDNEDIRTIIETFDKYIIGETNETYERYVFNKRDQKPEESVELYISALKDLLQSCNFCDCIHETR